MRKLLALAAAAAVAGGLASIPAADLVARSHSCGYHCNQGGYGVTPAAPSTTQAEVQLVGRTNVHSGGRAGGKALPRKGNAGSYNKKSGWH